MLRLAEQREREAELEQTVRDVAVPLRERLRVLGHVLRLGLEVRDVRELALQNLSLIHISEPTRLLSISVGGVGV